MQNLRRCRVWVLPPRSVREGTLASASGESVVSTNTLSPTVDVVEAPRENGSLMANRTTNAFSSEHLAGRLMAVVNICLNRGAASKGGCSHDLRLLKNDLAGEKASS